VFTGFGGDKTKWKIDGRQGMMTKREDAEPSTVQEEWKLKHELDLKGDSAVSGSFS
jgi:hypothetical protein